VNMSLSEVCLFFCFVFLLSEHSGQCLHSRLNHIFSARHMNASVLTELAIFLEPLSITSAVCSEALIAPSLAGWSVRRKEIDGSAVVECNESTNTSLLYLSTFFTYLYLSRINSAYFLLLLRYILQQLLYFLLHYISTTSVTFSDQFFPCQNLI